jgi:anti-sigma regulatory factor (Ser/Thr protein kinase)
MCLGLLKETGLFTYESFSLHEGSHLILFSDGISRQDIEGVLTGRPAMLHEAEPHCFSRMLLDAVLEKRRQADDMLVFTLHGSDAQSRDELRYEFLSSYEGVDRAHEWAASCITGRDVPLGHDRDFVLLAIREVLLNAVEHGNRMRPDSWVDLSIDKSGGGLVVRVSDEGAGFDLEKQARRIRDHDALNSDKRGLYIIDSTADCIDVDGGTIELHIQERRREAGE